MTDQQTFFFSLGAQRSGTTWLYRMFHAHPQAYVPEVKELHYFDYFEDIREFDLYEILRAHRRRAKRGFGVAGLVHEGEEQKKRQLSFIKDYLKLLEIGKIDEDAYKKFLLNRAGGARLICDVTPGYCLVTGERLASMAKIWPRVRMLFSMRDPLSRLWSRARGLAMKNKLRERSESVASAQTRLLNNFSKSSDDHRVLQQSDYRSIVKKIRASVPEEIVRISFYEDLFGENANRERKALTDFLGIDEMPIENLPEAQNVSEKAELPEKAARELVARFRPQYDFVREEFGRIPSAWERSLQRYG